MDPVLAFRQIFPVAESTDIGGLVHRDSAGTAAIRFNREGRLVPHDSAEDRESSQYRGEPPSTGILVRNGEFWTVGFRSSTFLLRDMKGLAYVQRLLHRPGEEFHVLDLLAEAGAVAQPDASDVETGSLPVGINVRRNLAGDAGEILDQQAKREYKKRIDELRERMEDLRERGDEKGLGEAEAEYDFLLQQLSGAVGRGGRDRRAGSIAERARLNVQRAIKTAVLKVAEHDALFGEILARSIKTGLFCSYVPEVRAPATWQFSLENVVPESGVEPAEPIVPARETTFLSAFTNGTKLVGREAERALLSKALDDAIAGHGKVILIGGAAGVGKTRVAAEIGAEALRRGARAYVGSCYERDDPFPLIPFVEILEGALADSSSPAAFRQALDKDAGEIARLLPRLRRLFPDIPPPAELSPDQSRRILFTALAELLARSARNAAIAILLDDLHWADEATVSLLNYLAQLVPKMRVLIVGTYRDFALDPSTPLTRTFEELIRLHLVERVNLTGLSRSDLGSMLRALSGREAPDSIVRVFHTYTEGNPFFVEELFRHLADSGKLFDSDGEFRADFRFSELDVPQSLRLLIGRRLMQLSDRTTKSLAAAAVIGRSFTLELLAASMQADPELLLDCVEEAERSGLISSAVLYPEVQFRFSHELIRQAVAQTLSVIRRQRLHLDVSIAMERLYSETIEDHVIDLAHHLWEAGALADPYKTVRYLAMAATREREQGALTEVEARYLQALEVLSHTPESLQRDEQELVLQLGLGSISIATHGYTAPKTAAAYERASILGERLGDPSQVVLALTGCFAVPLLRGQTDETRVLADQVQAAGERGGMPKTRIWGHMLQGVSRYHAGDLSGANDHLCTAIELYNPDDHRNNPQDPCTDSMEYLAVTTWQLGRADTARARMNEALALAAKLGKPYVKAHSQFFAAYLNALMRDPLKTQQYAEGTIAHSVEQQIPLFSDASRILLGWALVEQGRDEGLKMARQGLANYRGAGNLNAIGTFLCFLAQAQARCGSIEEALATVNEGLASNQKQLTDRPHLLWLRGELLLSTLAQSDALSTAEHGALTDAAELSFRDAISLANEIGAKTYALRASTSLGRMLHKDGHSSAAREMLGPLYADFSEGFDTLDLQEAKALLGQLS